MIVFTTLIKAGIILAWACQVGYTACVGTSEDRRDLVLATVLYIFALNNL